MLHLPAFGVRSGRINTFVRPNTLSRIVYRHRASPRDRVTRVECSLDIILIRCY
jgi:hypothetical protein